MGTRNDVTFSQERVAETAPLTLKSSNLARRAPLLQVLCFETWLLMYLHADI
jgi:hypothetical protein